MSYLSKLLSILLVSTLISFGFSNNAQASTTLVPVISASNGVNTVHVDSSGKIWTSVNGVVPKLTYSGLEKNGVTSLSYSNGLFIASSFFYVAYSADGIGWKRNYFPVGEAFDAGEIISDENFFNRNVMTIDSIQSFLESKVSCSNGNCLKDYRETTFDRPANIMCDAYIGQENETASQIIFNVAKACKINPEVLIVLLQKEQGLVTSSAPTTGKFLKATGYGCPDNADCNAAFFGFYNQVYLAARQFQRYANPSGTSLYYTWYPVGKATSILYNPNTLCGSSTVTIKNKATAGLYYYTPYQPNEASLNAIWGEGDSCSAYGNRNFWQYYNAWFNPEKDFKTWLIWNGSQYIAMDDEGTVAVSSNLTSWTLKPKFSNIKSFLKDSDGIIKAVTTDDKVFSTVDGATWAPSSLVPPPTQVNDSKPKAVYHKAVRGNTLSGIASKYKTTVKNIMKWNPSIKNASLIKVGQKIIVGWKK